MENVFWGLTFMGGFVALLGIVLVIYAEHEFGDKSKHKKNEES